MLKINKLLTLTVLFLNIVQGEAQTLKETAEAKMDQLSLLITEVEAQQKDVLKEKITLRSAEIFLKFADWDEANISKNQRYFELGWHYRDNAVETAKNLPNFEREDVIKMLDEAIATLQRLKEDKISRTKSTNIDWSNVVQEDDQLTFNGRPTFLADWTWKPSSQELEEYHGKLDGVFITPAHVIDEQGTINPNQLNALKSKGEGTTGFIFINHRNIPQWAKDKYGDAFTIKDKGSVRYTEYDIDHPGAQNLIGSLIAGMVLEMTGKKYTGLGYMLCNEPHFITSKKSDGTINWASTGVSNYTIEAFKEWLKQKHVNIHNLNETWGSSFNSFDALTIEIPMSEALQGTPIWYDWMRFNMNRVTKWYQFIADTVKHHDPLAKVHLKLIPGMWTNGERDHGLDFEALTELSDIIGNDTGASHRSYPWKTEDWEAKYQFEWREMAMAHDFFKSVSPKKIMFNSESHYLSTKASLNLTLNPMHARATYWLAHTQGMTASQTWYWARTLNGDKRSGDDAGYGGSNNHQPRVTNELHTTMVDLNAHAEKIMAFQRQRKPIRIFYSEASAINKHHYMDELFELYESMYFDGINMGFATNKILSTQSADNWDVVIVHKTQFATEKDIKALQNYINNGGVVILDKESFTKNEYSQALTQLTGTTSANNITDIKNAAYAILKEKNQLAGITIKETNSAGFATCTWKSFKTDSSSHILSIVNVGKTNADITIQLKEFSKGTSCKDLLTGVEINNVQTLKPYDVLFLEVKDEASKVLNLENDPKKKVMVDVFPNPTHDKFTITLDKTYQHISVQLIDMNGRNILTQQFHHHKQFQLTLGQKVKTGNYILKVTTDDKQHYTKVIKY